MLRIQMAWFRSAKVLADACQHAESQERPYDYICYLEDDIIIYDPDFFLNFAF